MIIAIRLVRISQIFRIRQRSETITSSNGIIPLPAQQSLGMDIAEIVIVASLDKGKPNKLSLANARSQHSGNGSIFNNSPFPTRKDLAIDHPEGNYRGTVSQCLRQP